MSYQDRQDTIDWLKDLNEALLELFKAFCLVILILLGLLIIVCFIVITIHDIAQHFS